LLPGATLTATSPGGKVIEEPDNNQGVWVAGNARTEGSFSATVQLLTAIKDVGGACVYGSNYPPVGEYLSASEISFTGTPEYKVVLERNDKSTYTATVGKNESLSIPNGEAALSFTDRTGAPGKLGCIPPSTYTLSGADVCVDTDVTLTLSGSENGWRYQLYKDNIPVGSETEGTGGALTFSETSTDVGRFSYTVRTVDATGAQCEMQVSNVHIITVKPVPTITRSGGNVSQSVDWYTAISAMTYTASDAAVISKTVGDFPAGVTGTPSGTPSGTSYTISGMPTEPGTFGYSLTATVAATGCTSAAAVGTITVNVGTPPGAASTQTWVIGTQTWSAPLQKAQTGCTAVNDLGTTNPPTSALYRSSDLYSESGYLYNWKCVNDYATQLCPSPWRVPEPDDFINLDKALGGDGENRRADPEYVLSTYGEIMGTLWGGYAIGPDLHEPGTNTSQWSSEDYSDEAAYAAGWNKTGTVHTKMPADKYRGYQVRCVK
jgi:uncharacterized protein (TIGR02145 family)